MSRIVIVAGFLLAGLAGCASGARAAPPAGSLDEAAAGRFATLAQTCLHQEYPNHVSLMLNSEADSKPPHLLYPAFYGCLDWHSDVHGHWLLVRLLRLYPGAPFAEAARAEIAKSLTPDNIAAEVASMTQPGRASFERPYGLAWLPQALSPATKG